MMQVWLWVWCASRLVLEVPGQDAYQSCSWSCPEEDAMVWRQVQKLDYAGTELSSFWHILREHTQQLRIGLEACPPGALVLQLWALLAQSHSMVGSAKRPLLEAAQLQLSAGCKPIEALAALAKRVSSTTTAHVSNLRAASLWAPALLGTLRRLGAELRSGVEEDFPLKPCRDVIRYHGRGSEDIFRAHWVQNPNAVLPVHYAVAYVQLGHGRCNLGMATAITALARSLRQLSARTPSASALGGWANDECASLASLAISYFAGYDAAEMAGSDWLPFDVLHDLSQDWLQTGEAPAPVVRPGIGSHATSWRYAEEDWPAALPWDVAAECTAIWQQAPVMAQLAVALFSFRGNASSTESILITQLLERVSTLPERVFSSCEIGSVARGLALRLLASPAEAARAICEGRMQQEWEVLRSFGTEFFVDRQFGYWGVLVFGLLARLRAHLRGHVTCLGTYRVEQCKPKAFSVTFNELLRRAVDDGVLASVGAAAAFLARISSLCGLGIASAHAAIADTVIVLALSGETQYFTIPTPSFQDASMTRLSEQDWLNFTAEDDSTNFTTLEQNLLKILQTSPHGAPSPSAAFAGPLPRRGNLSSLSFGVAKHDVRLLLDAAWTVAAGEPFEMIIGGPWPLAEICLRVFGHLAALSSWRPVHRRKLQTVAGETKQSEVTAAVLESPGNDAETLENLTGFTLENVMRAPPLLPQRSCENPAECGVAQSPSHLVLPSSVGGANAALHENAEQLGLLDEIEAQLESGGDAELADQLFAAISREGGAAGRSPLLRAALWLHKQHFDAGGIARPGKGFSKFRRRLQLLLGHTGTMSVT